MGSSTASTTKQQQGTQRDYTPIQRRAGQYPQSGNPRNEEQVEQFEQRVQELWDQAERFKSNNPRLTEQAQDHLMIALMFARRAATE